MADDPAEGAGGHLLRRLLFRNQAGEAVPALWLPPPEGPAVLYCHAHGGRYDIGMAELTDGRPALRRPRLPELAARGWGALCVEMRCFGARAEPAEGPLAKARLWHGRTLFGQMLGKAGPGSTGFLRSRGWTRRGSRSWAS